MAARFVNVDRDTALLLPPDMRDWVPPNHLVHFVLDAVGQLDLSSARVNERGSGSEQYPPALLLGLLIYSYATGTFGSRRIEQSTYENVAVRVLTADTHPDHDTICAFRRENKALLSASFVQVLQLAQALKLARFGQVTVSIDGTKVAANASKHAAVSYQRAGEMIAQLELEVQQLIAKAEQSDAMPLQDGLSIPEEIVRRQERKAALAKARAEIEARAHARYTRELARHEEKRARRCIHRWKSAATTAASPISKRSLRRRRRHPLPARASGCATGSRRHQEKPSTNCASKPSNRSSASSRV